MAPLSPLRDHLKEELRADIGQGYVSNIVQRNQGVLLAVYERRTLHHGWHADPGLGLAEELPLQRRLQRRRWGELPRQKRCNKTHESTTDANARLWLSKKSYVS